MDERLNLMLDAKDAERIERLRPVAYENDASVRAGGPPSRADIARLALLEGLDRLEARYGVADAPAVLEVAAEAGVI